MHPIVNSILGGPYIFTHEEHGKCELVQDIYIFKKKKGEDIVDSNPRNGSLGYLKILEECSDPNDEDKAHPDISLFWKELLTSAHPSASEYFEDINPDIWHHNYKSKVNFVADPGAIFRHVIGLTGRAYKKDSEISPEEKDKYINNMKLPDGKTANYDTAFSNSVNLIVNTWLRIFDNIEKNSLNKIEEYVKDWNLDTGVNESLIDLWAVKGELK